MEGMDPNNPPPKGTRVAIKRWEYTDPVGVPHPDVVDLAVEIRNDSHMTVEGVSPVVQIRWSEGLLRHKESAAWGKVIVLPAPVAINLAAGETKTLHFNIDVATKMAELARKQEWPWSLRAIITGAAPTPTKLDLPIVPGD
jgi:hypothetical protein